MPTDGNKSKQIKDSVHGYIEIENKFIKIINTAVFQRLKRLQQTSYRALYPSASHDRFIHSIGVFHLGTLVFNAIKKNTESNIINNCDKNFGDMLENWRDSFLVACLLHDIGHAPFSHTCEVFFNPDDLLINDLKNELKNKADRDIADSFEDDYKNSKSAKPHEIMSALVLLKCDELQIANLFNFKPKDYDFAVRAIIGCPYGYYTEKPDDESDIKNALIRILNSSMIDVDKLDYIVRDAVLSGYQNVEMDLPRLTSSFIFFRNQDNRIWPMYKHSAQSVIENVFTARNNEFKWITSHNVVAYETALLKSAIFCITKKMDINPQQIFNYNAITGAGVTIKDSIREYRYLGDEDIICLLKDFYNNVPEVKEYFDRNIRKKAIWKTHSEYIALFNDEADDAYEKFSVFITNPKNETELKMINGKNFMHYLNELNEDDRKKYERFFRRMGFNFSLSDKTADEIVFMSYDAESFTKNINANEVYILYHKTYKPLNEVVSFDDNYCFRAAESSNNMAKIEVPAKRGFFVFYKPHGKAINGDKFKEEYNASIVGKRRTTPQ